MTLAAKLVALRKQKGLTQLELAEELNVSRQAISRWEVGAAIPSMENLRSLGKLYAVSVDYLLDDVLDTRNDPEEKEISVCSDEPTSFPGRKIKRWTLVFFAGVVLLVIVVCMCVKQIGRSNESESLTPYSDLDTDSNDYSTETFQLEW